MSDSEAELQDAAPRQAAVEYPRSNARAPSRGGPDGGEAAAPAAPAPATESPQAALPAGAPEAAEARSPAPAVADSAPPRRARREPPAAGLDSEASPLAGVAAAAIRAELERRARRTRMLLAEREQVVAAIAALDAQLAALQRDLRSRRAPAARGAVRRGARRRSA
jgi:hypothetical protein